MSIDFLIKKLADIKTESVSHDPAIHKKVLLSPSESQSNLTAVSYYTLQPGQEISLHKHPTMEESLFILEGNLHYEVESQAITLEPGDLLLVRADRLHSGRAGQQGCIMLGFGVALDRPGDVAHR